MKCPIGGLRRSAFRASHQFKRADATPAATTAPATGTIFRAILEGVRARSVLTECTVGASVGARPPRRPRGVALRGNGALRRSFLSYLCGVRGISVSLAGFEREGLLEKWSILSRLRPAKERVLVAECANADASVRKENQISLDNRHQTSAENIDA